MSTNLSVQKQRNTEGQGSLSYIYIYSFTPVYMSGRDRPEAKDKENDDGSKKSTEKVNRNSLLLPAKGLSIL